MSDYTNTQVTSSGNFTADPAEMKRIGEQIIAKGTDFDDKIKEIYAYIEDMETHDYISPEAKVIANELRTYRDSMEKLGKAIKAHGKYLNASGDAVTNNQDNIIANVSTD